ncbi:MAG: glycosyltransferase family 2 protein [Bacteroidales bacterium]|nr:glycosyltransferase family 2 protein [Bacteroidales bacterium]
MNPLVSVIMPMYNAAPFVEEAVLSVLNQSYTNLELIVVNDGSTDNSMEVLGRIHDPRLRVISQINQGAQVARNRGISESRGEYLKFLDADDILYPEALATQVEQMADLADNESVFGDFDILDEKGCVIHQNRPDWTTFDRCDQATWLLGNWFIITSVPLHHRQQVIKAGGFDIRLKDHHERKFHYDLVMSGSRFVYRPCVVYGYRCYTSPNRISCNRFNVAPLYQLEYMRESFMSKAAANYGTESNPIAQRFMRYLMHKAEQYALLGKYPEGHYCYLKARSISFHGPLKYRGSSKLGLLYQVLVPLLGFKHAARIMYRIACLTGLAKDGGDELSQMVANGK